MKKSKIIKIVISIRLSSILLMGCGSKNTNTKSSNADTETQTTQKEEKKIKLDKENAIVLTDDNSYKTVFDLFEKQEIKAKREYLNKTFKVTGEIEDIQKENGFINIYINYSENNHNYNVDFCIEDNEENEAKTADFKKADGLDKGTILTGYGILEKFDKFNHSANFLRLTNCEF